MSPEVQYLWILVRGHLARVRDDERGVSAVEWVIITVRADRHRSRSASASSISGKVTEQGRASISL